MYYSLRALAWAITSSPTDFDVGVRKADPVTLQGVSIAAQSDTEHGKGF